MKMQKLSVVRCLVVVIGRRFKKSTLGSNSPKFGLKKQQASRKSASAFLPFGTETTKSFAPGLFSCLRKEFLMFVPNSMRLSAK